MTTTRVHPLTAALEAMVLALDAELTNQDEKARSLGRLRTHTRRTIAARSGHDGDDDTPARTDDIEADEVPDA